MRKRLSIKGGITLLAVLGLIAIGVAYAVEISRPITGSVIIGQVKTAEETILLYAEIEPTLVDLTELRFDPADINAFGLFTSPPRIPFAAKKRRRHTLRPEGRANRREAERGRRCPTMRCPC